MGRTCSLRRRQGAVRQAGPDRARGLPLPDLRVRRRRARQPRRRRRQPAALAQRVDRRPQHGLRRVAVGLRARQVATPTGARRGRTAAPDRPGVGETVELPDGLGSVTFEEIVLVAADPDQPDAGQGVALAGRRARAGRADGVAVHPARAGSGCASPRRRTAPSSRWPPSTGPEAATSTPCSRTWSRSLYGEETIVTDAAWGTLSNQAIAAAGVVYFLALLAHVVEWSSLRQARPRPGSLVGAAGAEVTDPPAAPDGRRAPGARRAVRPPRPAADRARRGRPPPRPGRPRDERGPQPGARGATCTSSRSRAHSSSRRSTSCSTAASRSTGSARSSSRFVLALLMVAVDLALRPDRPAARRARLALAGHPRRLRDPRRRARSPSAGCLGRSTCSRPSRRGRPQTGVLGPGPVARGPRPDRLPDPRLRASRSGPSRS